jgi:hypothetical protein
LKLTRAQSLPGFFNSDLWHLQSPRFDPAGSSSGSELNHAATRAHIRVGCRLTSSSFVIRLDDRPQGHWFRRSATKGTRHHGVGALGSALTYPSEVSSPRPRHRGITWRLGRGLRLRLSPPSRRAFFAVRSHTRLSAKTPASRSPPALPKSGMR